MKSPWQQPSQGLALLEPIVWVVSFFGIASAVAFGKFLLAVVIALVAFSLVLRVRKRLRAIRRASPESKSP